MFVNFSFSTGYFLLLRKKQRNLWCGCEDVDVACRKPIREYEVPEVTLNHKSGVDPQSLLEQNFQWISEWWFQIFFMFTPKIAEDPHFD